MEDYEFEWVEVKVPRFLLEDLSLVVAYEVDDYQGRNLLARAEALIHLEDQLLSMRGL